MGTEYKSSDINIAGSLTVGSNLFTAAGLAVGAAADAAAQADLLPVGTATQTALDLKQSKSTDPQALILSGGTGDFLATNGLYVRQADSGGFASWKHTTDANLSIQQVDTGLGFQTSLFDLGIYDNRFRFGVGDHVGAYTDVIDLIGDATYALNGAGTTPTSSVAPLALKEEPDIQASTPLTGATIALTQNDRDILVALTPAGTIATQTITMPSSPRPGQRVELSTSSTITALTLNGGTFIGTITTLAANGFAAFRFDRVKWRRVS